jgi:hypothetical protein
VYSFLRTIFLKSTNLQHLGSSERMDRMEVSSGRFERMDRMEFSSGRFERMDRMEFSSGRFERMDRMEVSSGSSSESKKLTSSGWLIRTDALGCSWPFCGVEPLGSLHKLKF